MRIINVELRNELLKIKGVENILVDLAHTDNLRILDCEDDIVGGPYRLIGIEFIGPKAICTGDSSKFESESFKIKRIEYTKYNSLEQQMSTKNKNTNESVVRLLPDFMNMVLLEMVNPSTGETTYENVPHDITTVRQALHWRKPDLMRRIPVCDTHGADWYQQGDVYIWPENATSLKSLPAKIT
jgi:hypothetical protein